MIDIRQSSPYLTYLSQIGWQVDVFHDTAIFIKHLPILGNVVKVQRPQTLTVHLLSYIETNYHPFLTIIEPALPAQQNLLIKAGFKQSNSPYLPSKTIELKLDPSKETLFNNFKKDARSAIKKATETKLVTTTDIYKFRTLWKKAVPRSRYVPSEKELQTLQESFNANSLFIFSQAYEAGAGFLLANKRAYYWFAFTGKKGRNVQIQYYIVWQGIKWARNKGAKLMDFEGIFDERFPIKSWKGFSHFKKSFGGTEKTYPGAFVKRTFPLQIVNSLFK